MNDNRTSTVDGVHVREVARFVGRERDHLRHPALEAVGGEEDPIAAAISLWFAPVAATPRGNDLGTVETKDQRFPAKTSNPVDLSTRWVSDLPRHRRGDRTRGDGYDPGVHIDQSGNSQGVFIDDVELCAVE